jgi:hypothetical protein
MLTKFCSVNELPTRTRESRLSPELSGSRNRNLTKSNGTLRAMPSRIPKDVTQILLANSPISSFRGVRTLPNLVARFRSNFNL